MEQERSLDSVLGDFKNLRGNFNTTLKKHIEADGQIMPEKLSDP